MPRKCARSAVNPRVGCGLHAFRHGEDLLSPPLLVAEIADTEYRRTIGRYALYGEFAAGGMATVHFGRVLGDQGVSRVVAIKCLLPDLAKDPAFVRMFLAEGRLASRVRHPNVVATHEVVSIAGELFHIMEYVAGESLSRLVRKCRELGEPIPPRIAVAIACGLLEGLHAAHEAKSERGNPLGLVHRDVSPQNCHVGADGTSRVLDFGIATATNMVDEAPDHIKGKVAYMAPEQLAHETVDRRTDVYAASVVLWEMLAGQRLFKADDISTLIVRIIADPVELPSTLAKDIPQELDMVIMKGLEREIRDRWSSAREMAVLLEKVLPPAPAREVAEWVERVGGDRLRYRAEVVSEIESQSIDNIPIPETARGPKPTLPNATAELQALNENALPSAVEKALASDPMIRALLSRRSQPVILIEKGDAPLPTVASPSLPFAPTEPALFTETAKKEGAASAQKTAKSPATASDAPPKVSPSQAPPQGTSGQMAAVTSLPSSNAIAAQPRPRSVGKTVGIAIAVVALIGGAAYVGTVLGAVDPAKPKPNAASSASDPEEAIKIGVSTPSPVVDAGECTNPFTIDAQGNKKPKAQCFGTKP